jgi:hypothetical protein
MEGIYKTLIASGIIGVLISSLINLIVSLRGFKEQRDVKMLSAKFDFLRDKMVALRQIREELIDLKSTESKEIILNIIFETDDEKERHKRAGKWMTKEFNKHKYRKNLFRKNSFFFTKEERKSLEEVLRNIGFPEEITEMWMVANPQGNEKLSKEKQLEIGLKLLGHRFDLIHTFEETLLEYIDKELCEASDILMNQHSA